MVTRGAGSFVTMSEGPQRSLGECAQGLDVGNALKGHGSERLGAKDGLSSLQSVTSVRGIGEGEGEGEVCSCPGCGHKVSGTG